jgi:hypothetical protein
MLLSPFAFIQGRVNLEAKKYKGGGDEVTLNISQRKALLTKEEVK